MYSYLFTPKVWKMPKIRRVISEWFEVQQIGGSDLRLVSKSASECNSLCLANWKSNNRLVEEGCIDVCLLKVPQNFLLCQILPLKTWSIANIISNSPYKNALLLLVILQTPFHRAMTIEVFRINHWAESFIKSTCNKAINPGINTQIGPRSYADLFFKIYLFIHQHMQCSPLIRMV